MSNWEDAPDDWEDEHTPTGEQYLKSIGKGAAGTMAAGLDILSGIVKIPIATAATVMAKARRPDMNLDELWAAAQQTPLTRLDSAKQAMGISDDNLGYSAPMYPFEKFGEGVNFVADKLGELTGSKDVAGSAKIAANFLPIPGAKIAGRGLRKVVETVDPGLRNVKVKKPSTWDNIPDEPKTETVSPEAGMSAEDLMWRDRAKEQQVMAQYRAADDAQAARLEAELARRNEPIGTMRGTPEGEVLTPDNIVVEDAMHRARVAQETPAAADMLMAERQKALEQEVARQQGLDFNAAERARQATSPTGFAQHVAEQARAEFPDAYAKVLEAQQAMADAAQAAKEATTAKEAIEAGKRQRAAQVALEERQRAMEIEVARNAALEKQARERAQQETAPVTSPEMMRDLEARNAAEIQASIDKTQELNTHGQQMGIVEDYGNNDPMSRMPEMRVDENGMPIRADLSIEAQNLQNPLQRNLWGDELGPALGQGRSLTEAIDSMPPSHAKDMALSQLTGQEPPRSTMMNRDFWSNQKADTAPFTPTMKRKGNLKQGGFIDISDVSRAVKDVLAALDRTTAKFSKIDIARLTPKDNSDYAKQIPGMEKVANRFVLRPEDAASVIEKGLKEPDMPAIRKDIAMGPELTAEKYKNSLVGWGSKFLQWADKKGELANRELVRPVEKTIASLDKSSLELLAEGLKREMFRKERFTDAELSQVLNPKLMEAYKALRDQFDTVYELQARNLEAQGRRVPTKQEAYLAAMRNGNYHVSVRNADGKPVWHTQAKTSWEAKKAVDWLKANVPEAKDAKWEYRGSNLAANVPRDVLGSFQEIAKLLDDDSIGSAAIQEAIRKAQEDAGYDFRNQSDRFLNKQNVRGFDGDMPWLSPTENAKRLLHNQIDYLKNAYEWSYMQDALGQIKEVLADPTLIQDRPNAVEYLKEVVRQQIGMGDHLTKAAEEYVMSSVGMSRAALTKATGEVGRWTSLLQLGGNLGYAIATPLTALYSVALHTREGTLSGRAMVNSILDGSAGLINNLLHEGGKSERMPMTEFGREMLKYAEDNGIIVKDMLGDNFDIDRSKLSKGIHQSLEWTIRGPEKIQRLMTFMSFAHGLKETGKYNSMAEIAQRAETLTNIAATNFRKSELPMGVQKLGVVGSTAFKYKAPLLNYYHQLHLNGIEAKKGNVKPLLAMLGITAVLGGVQNLPGINEIDGAWELVKKGIANIKPESYNSVKDVSVKGAIQNSLPEVAAFGAVQTALGAQMSQRFGTDLANVEDPLKNMFPAASMAGNVLSGVGDLAKGNVPGAAWHVAPQAIKGNIEVSSDAFKAPNRPGGYVKPSDAGDTADVNIIRNENDVAMRKLGLRSSSEARQLEQRARENNEASNVTKASDKLMNNIINKSSRKTDEVDKYATAWIKLNPDADIRQAIAAGISKSTLTPEERKIVAGKSLDAILRAQRVMEIKRK